MRKSWFNMDTVAQAAEGERHLNIEIFGEIGWDVDASAFSRAIIAAGDVGQINLSIHSPGGSVFDGWAVANILLNHPAKVCARVEGMAASMASVILMAADVREVPENAYVMIHNVFGIGFGGGDEVRRAADLIDKLQEDITNFYAARTGQSVDDLRAWMSVDTWMNGAEALERGFATALLPVVQMAALTAGIEGMHRRFSNLPSALEDLKEVEEETKGDTTDKEGETEEEEGEEEPEEEHEEDHKSRLSKLQSIKNFFRPEGSDPENNLKNLRAELLAARNDRDKFANSVETLERENNRLQREARDLDAVLEELGMSAAEAADLPANNDEELILTVREKFAKITDADERRAFYQSHKRELEK